MKRFSKLLFLCVALLSATRINATCESDSLALVVLYTATNGQDWNNSWNLNSPVAQWYGIETDPLTDCVLEVNLDENNLTGTLPDELGGLENLEVLNLSDNNLTGSIPASLGNLLFLKKLDLSFNDLMDSIPAELGSLQELRQLDLSFNEISGSLPIALGSLERVEQLRFASNNLSGNIPASFGGLNKLSGLFLSFNALTGTIPIEFESLENLRYLYLNDNELSGEIIGNLENLSQLVLHDNKFTFDGLENINWSGLNYFSFSPQDSIELYQDGKTIYVDADGTLADNTYYWYRDGILLEAVQGDSTYIPYRAGVYSCRIEKSIGTGLFYLNSKTVEIEARVLPGDMNHDGAVNYIDVLHGGMSIAEGSAGVARPNATTDCNIEESEDWAIEIADVNGKHQDADGDGIVNMADLEIIEQNYGCSVPDTINVPVAQSDLEFVITGNDTIIEGEPAHVFEIYVDGMDSLSGIAFNFNYSGVQTTIPVNENNITIDVSESWLAPSFTLWSSVLTETTIEMAMTRTDGVLKDPKPDIPVVRIVVIEDLTGFLAGDISATISGVAMRSQESLKTIDGFYYEALETTLTATDERIAASTNEITNIYPTIIGAESTLNIALNAVRAEEAIILVSDIYGRLIDSRPVQLNIADNHILYPTHRLSAQGTYVLQIKGKNWISSPKRIIKAK